MLAFVVPGLSVRRSNLVGVGPQLVQRATRRPQRCAWATWRLQIAEESFDFFLGNAERAPSDSLLPTDGSDLPEGGGSKEWLNYRRVNEVRERLRVHERDTGSPEYQIATLTERINIITEHLKDHPKDFASTRGLSMLNARRRRLLRYLQSVDIERFDRLVSSLNLRVRREDTTLSRRRDVADKRL
jgi:small subunit ribosomal protein S15